MKKNNFNHISTYEDIYIKLQNVLNEFLENVDSTYIKDFYFNPKATNDKNLTNSLIAIDLSPNELIHKLENSYLSRASIKGEIGIASKNQQYNGIINIALYMLMSNRLAKWYKYEKIQNPNIDKSEKALYVEKYAQYKSEKNEATIKLLYSLFIYKETVNDNNFFYGHSLDYKNRDTLIIDLPKYGQIGIHFGSKSNFENLKYLAKQNLTLILEKKLQLGQITEIQYKVLIWKVNADDILPEYSGKFYEQHVPSIPIKYCGNNFKKAQIALGLNGKEICEIDDDFIKNLCKNTYYNNRELYFLGIKLGFSKSQLETLSYFLRERNLKTLPHSKKQKQKLLDVKSLGREAVLLTTPEARRKVSNHEQRCSNDKRKEHKVR